MKLSPLACSFLFILCLIFGVVFCPDVPGSSVSPSVLLPEKKIQIAATTSAPATPALNAQYACVMDSSSHRILFQKDAGKKAAMASTTKIMTCILALEAKRGNDIVTTSSYAASMPKVHLGMQTGNQYYLRDLLYSLMLESHNDTAVAIAEHLGGSVDGFAAKMNQKANELGMKNTHFVTPNGLDKKEHYSTASDMCLLASYALKNKEFCSLIQTKSYQFTDIKKQHSYSVTNRDAFLSYYDGALGIKTGFTGNAGYCFVGAAKKGNITLVSCVLACGWPPNKSYKWADTRELMDYSFENFSLSAFPLQKLSQVNIPVEDGKKQVSRIQEISPPTAIFSRFDRIVVRYDIPDKLYAPIRKNIAIGTISFYINDTLFKKEKVFPTESIEKSCFSDTIGDVLNLWIETFGG